MNTPKISVILPVYNAEKYIEACLDSIIAQSFSDFEVILVDDGSPDNAGSICDEYAKKDPRFHAFHQENKGVSSARNLGLEHSNGEWITFIDPDDIVKPNYLKNLYEATDADTDLIIAGHERIKEGTTVPFLIIKINEGKYISQNLIRERNCHLIIASLWAKLFRSAKIQEAQIKFDEKISFAEDLIFNLEILSSLNRIKLISAVDYIYINYKASLMSKKHSFNAEYNLSHRQKKELYLSFIEKETPKYILNLLAFSLGKSINSMYSAPYKLPKAERLANLKTIFKNEADVIDNLPAKNRLKRMRHNLPTLDRFLDSKHNGILKYVLKLKIKLSNAKKAIKSIFVKKQKAKTKTIEI